MASEKKMTEVMVDPFPGAKVKIKKYRYDALCEFCEKVLGFVDFDVPAIGFYQRPSGLACGGCYHADQAAKAKAAKE